MNELHLFLSPHAAKHSSLGNPEYQTLHSIDEIDAQTGTGGGSLISVGCILGISDLSSDGCDLPLTHLSVFRGLLEGFNIPKTFTRRSPAWWQLAYRNIDVFIGAARWSGLLKAVTLSCERPTHSLGNSIYGGVT